MFTGPMWKRVRLGLFPVEVDKCRLSELEFLDRRGSGFKRVRKSATMTIYAIVLTERGKEMEVSSDYYRSTCEVRSG